MFLSFSHTGSHRALHSFPTRRSSDLLPLVVYRIYPETGREEMTRGSRIIGLNSRALRNLAGIGNDRDRKSTRLNSSHSQISYAVFCSKKTISTTSESRYRTRSCR